MRYFVFLFLSCNLFISAGCSSEATRHYLNGRILYRWIDYERQHSENKGVEYCVIEADHVTSCFDAISYASFDDTGNFLFIPSSFVSTKENIKKAILYDSSMKKIKEFFIPKGFAQAKVFNSGKIVLARSFNNTGESTLSNLVILPLEQSEPYQLTHFDVQNRPLIRGFDLSPDQDKVIFSYSYKKNISVTQTKIINIRGDVLRKLPFNNGADPTFSPDGKLIAMSYLYRNDPLSNTGRSTEIALYNLETDELTRLTHHHGIAGLPDFSPDGKKIVYVLWGDGGRANNLAVINIDGTGFHTLLPEDHVRQGQVSNPDWGP